MRQPGSFNEEPYYEQGGDDWGKINNLYYA
jgi:hypothetical protein